MLQGTAKKYKIEAPEDFRTWCSFVQQLALQRFKNLDAYLSPFLMQLQAFAIIWKSLNEKATVGHKMANAVYWNAGNGSTDNVF